MNTSITCGLYGGYEHIYNLWAGMGGTKMNTSITCGLYGGY